MDYHKNLLLFCSALYFSECFSDHDLEHSRAASKLCNSGTKVKGLAKGYKTDWCKNLN